MNGLSRGKNFTLSYRAGLHTGPLVPDSEAAEELGRLGDTTGRFAKGTLDLTAVQGLGAFLHPPRGLVRAIRLRKAHRRRRAHEPGRRKPSENVVHGGEDVLSVPSFSA